MKRKTGRLALVVGSLVTAMSVACSAGATATPGAASATPEVVPPPPTAATPTSLPPGFTAEAPTATPPPPASVTPEFTRIAFEPGRTSANVTGYVEANGMARYVLRALADQPLHVSITSPNEDVLLEIWGADGVPLKRHVDGSAFWRGRLPATQDYFIQAVSVGAASNFELSVIAYSRIEFAPGATSATVSGSIEANGIRHYVVRALAGQTMDARITSPFGDVLLTIWGEDGVPLKRIVDDRPDWRGELHATQDYYVEAVAVGGATNYELTVAISALGSEPTRIQFAPGATSAAVTGFLEAGATTRYVLGAQAGQSAYVSLDSPNRDVVLAVTGAGGPTLVGPEARTDFAAIATLPLTQDYVVSVISVGGGTGYTLRVAVPPPGTQPARVVFDPGATSATVTGWLDDGGGQASYAVRALAGQTMALDIVGAGWELGIWVEGLDGGAWRAPFGAHSLTVALPVTQDYVITVFSPPGAPAAQYTLEVRIPPP